MGLGKISKIFIYEKKGAAPISCDACELTVEDGIKGDWHGSDLQRQISILPVEVRDFQEEGFCLKKFKENVQVEGIDFSKTSPGTFLRRGEVVLQITEVFKKCYPELCELAKSGQDCSLRRQAVFAKVARGGWLRTGDDVKINTGQK